MILYAYYYLNNIRKLSVTGFIGKYFKFEQINLDKLCTLTIYLNYLMKNIKKKYKSLLNINTPLYYPLLKKHILSLIQWNQGKAKHIKFGFTVLSKFGDRLRVFTYNTLCFQNLY